MVSSIAALACNMKQQELGLAVGTKLMKTAMDSMEADAAGLDTLLDQAGKSMELKSQPHLGSNLDAKG